MLRIAKKVLGMYLFLFVAAAWIMGSGLPGLSWERSGNGAVNDSGEPCVFIAVPNRVNSPAAIENRSQGQKIHLLLIPLFIAMVFSYRRKPVKYLVNNSFRYIHEFLRRLTVSLLLGGNAPPIRLHS
jgi:hypothetical protein